MTRGNLGIQSNYGSFFSDFVDTMKIDHSFSTEMKIYGRDHHNSPTGSTGISYTSGLHT